jgi:hypothetical protein
MESPPENVYIKEAGDTRFPGPTTNYVGTAASAVQPDLDPAPGI